MVGLDFSKRMQWNQATVTALLGLSENFPRELCLKVDDQGHWGFLTTAWFPCQKTDVSSRCPGWSLEPDLKFGAPGLAQACPCAYGRTQHFGPLIELAGEFLKSNADVCEIKNHKLAAFSVTSNEKEFLQMLLQWLWSAASRNYAPLQEVGWIEQIQIAQLSQEQRQTMRWWSRLTELSTLVHNEKYTLLLKRSVESLFKTGGMSSLCRLCDQLALRQEQFIVLALNGQQLTPSGFHSEKNLWFEAFLSVIDERQLGLCLIAKQPVFSGSERDRRMRENSEYRWKARHSAEGFQYPLEEILRRGAWDRFCEALARADEMIKKL